MTDLAGRALAPGSAHGRALVLSEPLSFWGGIDIESGRVIDGHHPQAGADVRGKILFMPSGRGSSSSSTVLAEAIRAGTGPVGIVLLHADSILTLGAVVACILYGVERPVVVLGEGGYRRAKSGMHVSVEAPRGSGTATVRISANEGRPRRRGSP